MLRKHLLRPLLARLSFLFAMVGLAVTLVALALLLVFLIPEWRHQALDITSDWLTARRAASLGDTKTNPLFKLDIVAPSELTVEQARMATWLAKKYRINEAPMATFVSYAHKLGTQHKLDPALILAIVAIESNFHPYVQSQAGAQGMMQVMPRVHAKRYETHGGSLTAFDALTNMRVGVEVLVDSTKLKNGSLMEGLRFYFGGDLAVDANGNGYVAKVLAEQERIKRVATGAASE